MGFNFIKEFNSIKEAGENTDTNKASIVKCCKGQLRKANNYKWRYKEI
jgi:hypothetical protein